MPVPAEEFGGQPFGPEPPVAAPAQGDGTVESGEQEMLSLSVVRRDGEVVVQAVGEVDLLTVERFDVFVREQLAPAPDVLVLDLSGLSFLCSRGLAVLVSAQEQADTAGTELRVATGIAPAVLRPLQSTGLADVLTLEPSSEEVARDSPNPV